MNKVSLLKSLQNIIIATFIVIAIFYTLAIVYSKYNEFESEIKNRREDEISKVKSTLISEVSHVVEHVKFHRSEIKNRANIKVKERVYEAYGIANHIYTKFNGKKSKSEILKIIKESLRPIRFDNGNGYFFITNLDGIEILFADRPEMEGKNLIEAKDTNGKFVIKDMIKIVKDSSEGFYSYTWTKPGCEGDQYKKVAYVKHFEPFNCFIGTGIYLNDVNQVIQEEAILQIERIRFGEKGNEYIFAGTYEGVSLCGPAKGKNMFNAQDPNGVKIVQELIKNAKNGGGFVEYVLPKFKGYKPEPKISYSRGIDEWGWYIGAGMYIDQIEQRIAMLKQKRREQLINDIILIIILTLIIIVLFLLLMNYISKKVAKDISQFKTFFKNLAEQNQKIQRENIKFYEFDSLAEYANRMLFEKISAEKSLKRSEAQFEMLFSEAPIGIVLEDQNFNIIISNESFQNLLGYSASELKGVNSKEVSLQKDMDIDLKMFYEVLGGKKTSYSMEKRFKKKDGDIVWGFITRTVIFAEDNSPLWSIVMVEDYTERKKLQDQIRQAEKMETIGQLAGGIAHDFNNQLAGIMGFTELLYEMTAEQPELQKYTEYILNSVKNSADLTSQLLAFARKGKVQSISINLNEIIIEVESLLKHSIPKNISINKNLTTNVYNVQGDPTQIQNAILNLAINARDAMPDGGDITFITKPIIITPEDNKLKAYDVNPGEYLQVSVSDTGIGMSEEIQNKIFEPFFTTKELGKGTGMGLAAVYGTVKNHKGAISVKSTIGKGTSFDVIFPISKDSNVDKKGSSDDKMIKGEGLILLVDDEEMLRSMGSKLLENMGYSVVCCSNGQEAVDYYEKNWSKVSLVILDMIMPVMGGRDAFIVMKEINPMAKVVLASGYSVEGEAQALIKSGVKGFLQKPFRKAELSKIVSDTILS